MKHIKSRLWATILIIYMVIPVVAWAEDVHQLTVVAKPVIAGSFNTSSAQLASGNTIHLYAYANSNFTFKCWTDENGKEISRQMDFDYTMPAKNSQLTAEFDYNPANPANPAHNYWNKERGEMIVDDFSIGALQNAVRTALGYDNSSDVTSIIVAGVMNVNDFGIANSYSNCVLLDISRVTGINTIPSYAFDYTNLETVYLPASIEKIGTRAFAECSKLSALTIYAMTPPTLESSVFANVPEGLVVYVPAAAIGQYQDTEQWSKFTLLPIQEDIRSISVALPQGTKAADYDKMWLELTNTKSGQRLHYIMTDRAQYTFANIIKNTSWNVTLRNERGDVFGRIDNVEVKDEDVSVSFASLTKPQTVTLAVQTPDGKNVTGQTQITWTDAEGNYVAQGVSLAALPAGLKVNYAIALSQDLAMLYDAPKPTAYTLKDGGNSLTTKLAAIKQVTISGKVKDVATGMALNGAVVSASQTFAGKYSKTVNAKTDANGAFTMTVANVPTALAFAATDYVSQSVSMDPLAANETAKTLDDVSLKPISGATITVSFSYTTVDGETQNWYSDYQNVGYTLYNKTQGKAISQYNVQYPQIVLLEEVNGGDVLELTAESKTGAFKPVKATATISAEQKAEATFALVQLGQLKAEYAQSGNTSVVASLYDSTGKLLKTYSYQDMSLTVSDLADGSYTLVSMGSSQFFNSIYSLAQLPQSGLKAGTDYVQNAVTIQSGKVTELKIDLVPKLDESKFYYTGDNTSFTVNKPSIVAGNYLTLTGRIDFRQAYASGVSNVQLIVDLPEASEFVENSVMVGNSTGSYTLNGHQLTIPLARYTDRVRFCVIPTAGGDYAPSAFAQFDLNGKTIKQPIGSANYTAKDLSISVPSTVAKKEIPVSGTAVGKSTVEIYDNDILVGQTTTLANGSWATTIKLNSPYNLSTHEIHAIVKTAQGLEMRSESKSLTYDINALQVEKVTMYYSNPEISKNYELVYDFQNPSPSPMRYTYYIYNRSFTFTVDFTANDPTRISNVILYVKTGDGIWHPLETVYDQKKEKWVVNQEFGNMYDGIVPVNVDVSFDLVSDTPVDNSEAFNAEMDALDALSEKTIELAEKNITATLEEDDEKYSTFIINSDIPSEPLRVKVEPLDYEEAHGLMSKYQFTFAKEGEGYYCVRDTFANGIYEATIVDTNEKYALFISLEPANSNPVQKARRMAPAVKNSVIRNAIKAFKNQDGTMLFNGLGMFKDMLGLNKYADAAGFSNWLSMLDNYSDFDLQWRQASINAILAKCEDGNYRLNKDKREKLYNKLQEIEQAADGFHKMYFDYLEDYKTTLRNAAMYDIGINVATIGIGKALDAAAHGIAYSGRILTNSKNAKYFKYNLPAKNLLTRERMKNTIGFLATQAAGEIIGIFEPEVNDFQKISKNLGEWAPKQNAELTKAYQKLIQDAKQNYRNCKPEKEPEERNPHNPPTPDCEVPIDPSGYVYEGVFSNRLQGVTATCYYKETVEDMYGDLHENVVKWDAEEYAQQNPLFTDENGYYRWDVPNGLWQVKFEKEGYETTYSEWLPVPPPQLDINIPMKQNVQPSVKTARAFEDAVELEFDKYMQPELLTAENITVMVGSTAVEGTMELLNEEATREGETETFASKVRFNAAKPFDGKEVTLMVSNRVRSYAGIRMQDDFSQKFTIEPEVRQIDGGQEAKVYYSQSTKIPVSVLPAAAAAGKKLMVTSSSDMILAVEAETIQLDSEGKAEVSVSGELPGTAAITFKVEGYDLTGTTTVSVAMPTMGDTNGDSLINVADIVVLQDYLLGRQNAQFVRAAADVNGDGSVNQQDVEAIIARILTQR